MRTSRCAPIVLLVAGCLTAAGAWSCAAPGESPSTKPAAKKPGESTAPGKPGPSGQPDGARATDAAAGEYIEYRSQPELGRVTIADCAVRGQRPLDYLTKHADELEKRGIFACTDDKQRHIYRRTETVAERKIDTLVVVSPPTGDGDDEVPGTQQLVVRVNGHIKINCTIGTSADGGLWVSEVVIHADGGTLEIRALTDDGEELTLPEDWESLDNPTVITDDSFFEDVPEEMPGRKPVKA
jgi:hypothetical protein